jgi:hypothetical protein
MLRQLQLLSQPLRQESLSICMAETVGSTTTLSVDH